ncbi:PadR family transcriptional regulator [Stackebrandtia endophytica]|uniref:PadR family transcriptional regulator n=1 Tax=Stackebrandtia endophytica TaxID=1496996 RepID=A0A543AT27_9ACTN|nr:PadR family transcriptional regulator [Stackebrandtia endophytica]TQL75737.1 PadR family transcriptional regulator [Stackebrandtia endophytica]
MSLKHAILGILAIESMSGYELKKVINASVSHFWSADQSQVYRTLAGLVEDGLASRRTVAQENRPNLHLHTITDDGLAELDRWLASAWQPQPSREAFLARLFFTDRMTADQVMKLLDAREKEIREALAVLETIPFAGSALDQVAEIKNLLATHRQFPEDTGVDDAAPESIQLTEIGHVLRMATLANGLVHAKAELEWLADTKQQLERITS